jgi:hypothetical protein
MHAKPDLRVFLKWVIACSGSVITAVITPEDQNPFSIINYFDSLYDFCLLAGLGLGSSSPA